MYVCVYCVYVVVDDDGDAVDRNDDTTLQNSQSSCLPICCSVSVSVCFTVCVLRLALVGFECLARLNLSCLQTHTHTEFVRALRFAYTLWGSLTHSHTRSRCRSRSHRCRSQAESSSGATHQHNESFIFALP